MKEVATAIAGCRGATFPGYKGPEVKASRVCGAGVNCTLKG